MLSLHSASFALNMAVAPRASISMQEASPAPKVAEFCYGLPGSIAPVAEFDPFNFLEGKTKDQVRTQLNHRSRGPALSPHRSPC